MCITLKGGILNDLEECASKGQFTIGRGEVFVFDRRVSVGDGLKEAAHAAVAMACRRPDPCPKKPAAIRPCIREGVACHQTCADETSDEDKTRFRRAAKKQIALARQACRRILGASPPLIRIWIKPPPAAWHGRAVQDLAHDPDIEKIHANRPLIKACDSCRSGHRSSLKIQPPNGHCKDCRHDHETDVARLPHARACIQRTVTSIPRWELRSRPG